jgi:Flp pilus assembly protein TadD
MRLLGSACAQLGPEHFGEAERRLSEAVARATHLQARPELAHAWRERGKLLVINDRVAEARLDLVQAIDLYRATGMTFWLEDTEAFLAEACAGPRTSPRA